MKKPLANLKGHTLDEQIEQMLHTNQNDKDSCYIRDLHYLLRKKEIIARVQARLMIARQPEEIFGIVNKQAVIHYIHWQERTPIPLQPNSRLARTKFSWSRTAIGVVAVLLLVGMIGGMMLFFDAPNSQTPGTAYVATSMTSKVNVLFADPLDVNANHWPVLNSGPRRYLFQNGSYHIVNQGPDIAVVVQPEITFTTPWNYTLTMAQVQGNQASPTNAFGMIFGYTSVNGAMRFTSLEVTNAPDRPGASKIGLYRYDTGNRQQPWTELWSTTKLTAFHAGLNASNTMKISATAHDLTLMMNHRLIGTLQLQVGIGSVGMLVKGQGSEVAFQNLVVTRP